MQVALISGLGHEWGKPAHPGLVQLYSNLLRVGHSPTLVARDDTESWVEPFQAYVGHSLGCNAVERMADRDCRLAILIEPVRDWWGRKPFTLPCPTVAIYRRQWFGPWTCGVDSARRYVITGDHNTVVTKSIPAILNLLGLP